jgi:hypothetical protein
MRRLALFAVLALPADPRAPQRDATPAPSALDEVIASLDAELVAEAPDTRPPSNKKRHLKKGELTLTVARMAARYLSRPMGSEVVKVVEGRRYAFCVEEHYHAPESGQTPVGWHKGVTVYGFEE